VSARRLQIINARGLHARASAKFVKTAARFDAQVTVTAKARPWTPSPSWG
jgi:phosphocarrier protein